MSRCPVPLSEHNKGEHELDLHRSGLGGSAYCRTCNRYLYPESRDGGVAYEDRDSFTEETDTGGNDE